MMMSRILRTAALASAMAVLASVASAQGAPAGQPPATVAPNGIRIVPADQIKWTGEPGQRRSILFGDPDKPGPYAVLYEWGPGHNSKPHTHATDRFGYVVSGTWWMSTSSTPDKSTLVPAPAGSFVTHFANEVHWDGGVDNTAIVMVTGVGPVMTKQVGAPAP